MKAYPGTKVTVQANPQIGNQIRPQVVAGNPPDVIYLQVGERSGVTAGLIKEKGLLDLTDLFNGKALEGSGAHEQHQNPPDVGPVLRSQ